MDISSDSRGSSMTSAEGASRYSFVRLRAGVEDLWRWWSEELSAMVPARWRQWSLPKLRVEASASELLVFNPPQPAPIDRIQLSDTASGGAPPAGPFSRCELVLNSELGLAIPVTLPSAAETNLRNVIAYSLDRYTPFCEDEVHFDVRIIRRDRHNGKVELMLYVVQRATLERLMQQLVTVGLHAVTVDIIDAQQEPAVRAGVNLLQAESGQKPAVRARFNGVLAITALLLLLAVMLIPLYHSHQTIRELEHELDALRVPVQEAERLREDVNRRSDTLRIILQQRNAKPPALELLRELTRLTPDEAWAGQIEIKNGRLRVTGEAEAGSELMQALTVSGYFSDPRFEAPLTENPKSGRERFVISLGIKERPDER